MATKEASEVLESTRYSQLKSTRKTVNISAPNFQQAEFKIMGDIMVVHRFSKKIKDQLALKAMAGKSSSNKKVREAKDPVETFNEARYISSKGWDGFHAAAIRNAMISACRLVGFKMTIMKLSAFVIADGHDAKEPQIPLIRLYSEGPVNKTTNLPFPVMQDDICHVETGQPYVAYRPAYHNWSAKVRIKWDADQFSLEDMTNLMARVGTQVGLCEGRPDSKNSAGMGWGTFHVEGHREDKLAA